MPAAVALFVYNRLHLAQQTTEALMANELAAQTDLYVFSDGPKSPHDAERVEAVRRYFNEVKGFRSISLKTQRANLGLSNSIIAGVTELCARLGRVIVVEDDLVTSRHFLSYMNTALDLYEDEEDVISIHGYVYPLRHQLGETFFVRGADCWGWATWKRGWDLFDRDAPVLLRNLESSGLQQEFDFKYYPYTDMLRRQARGQNDSWAVRWYASAFLLGKLTLYPGKSLVENIGMDGSGTHSGTFSLRRQSVATNRVQVNPIPVVEDALARREFERFFMAVRARRSFAGVWRMARNPRWAARTIARSLKRAMRSTS
jgi:hypothetical protein